MPADNHKIKWCFVRHFEDMPNNPNGNTIYYIKDKQEIWVGDQLIANNANISEYKVKDVSITGSGDYVKSFAFDENTGIVSVVLDTLPTGQTISKGPTIHVDGETLRPGQAFTTSVDIDVNGTVISNKDREFTLPHQISNVNLEDTSNEGELKLTVSNTDPNVQPQITTIRVFNPANYMAASGGTATNATVDLAADPVNNMDAATKQYVDNSIQDATIRWNVITA